MEGWGRHGQESLIVGLGKIGPKAVDGGPRDISAGALGGGLGKTAARALDGGGQGRQ